MPGCTVGSRQAEHESHRESMEEDDMVKSRAIPSYRKERRRTDGGGRAVSPRDYKEVPRHSRRLGLAAAKRSLTLPPPWLGLAPSPYPNRLTMYRKMSSVKALLVHGKQEKDPPIKPAKQP